MLAISAEDLHPQIVAADRWAEQHLDLLVACFSDFSDTGEWPLIEALQHRFEVEGEDLDVARLAWEMPRQLGFAEQGRLILLCRALLHVDAAKPLLDAWFAAIQYAYRSWLEGPKEELISHEIVALFDGDEPLARQVSKLMYRESWMFGSGHGDPEGYWTREINSAVRIARKATNAAELLDARAALESEAIPGLPVIEEEPAVVLPLAPPAPQGGPAPASKKAGRLRRTWRYVTSNNYLAGLAVVGTILLVGFVAALLSHAFDAGGSDSPARRSPSVERAGEGGARTFRAPGQLQLEGPQVKPGQRVSVTCRVYAPKPASVVPDGYWYKLASPPWKGRYYAPANSFWNGDTPGKTPYTHNTDFSVPRC